MAFVARHGRSPTGTPRARRSPLAKAKSWRDGHTSPPFVSLDGRRTFVVTRAIEPRPPSTRHEPTMSLSPNNSRMVAAVALVAAACAGSRSDAASSTDSAAPKPPSIDQSVGSQTDTPFAFTNADLDAYERGMRKEIKLVKAAKARGDSAKTPEERGAASQAAFETSTAPAAAQAIGVPADRYAATR